MSKEELDRYQIDDILFSTFGLVVDLPEEGTFYRITDDLTGDYSLVWVPNVIEEYENLYTAGLEVVYTKDRKRFVSPSIMEFSKDERVEINSIKLMDKLTKGKPISVNIFGKFEGKPIVITYHNYPVAYGSVVNGEFTPLVDVGMYLREGN